MMTDPRRYLVRMLVFLLIVAAIAALLHAPLWRAFMGNPALNGVIVGALGLGIIYAFRQILRLVPERRWLTGIQKTGKLDNRQVKPVLLATVNAMLADQRQEAQLSALSLRSVLDGVAARLDEGREISRYMIGLLVFLGLLLGTFADHRRGRACRRIARYRRHRFQRHDGAVERWPRRAAFRHVDSLFLVIVRTCRLAHPRLS